MLWNTRRFAIKWLHLLNLRCSFSRVLGDHAISTERHPLDKLIGPFAFVVAASK